MTQVPHVTVYDIKTGEKVTKTLANARDAVLSGRFSWKPGAKWRATQSAPYAARTSAKEMPKITQEILDGAGKKVEAEGAAVQHDPVEQVDDDMRVEVEMSSAPAPAGVVGDDETPETADETADEIEADEPPVEEPAEIETPVTVAPAAPPRKGGRKPAAK